MSAAAPTVHDDPGRPAWRRGLLTAPPRTVDGARVRTWPAAIVVGVLAAVVAGIGSWVPNAWADEAATMSAARRSLPELWHMVQHVDAVHGLYYAAVHLWFDVVPATVPMLRVPSVVATGVAAGLTVVLGSRLAGRWTGIVAGVVFALLPRVTWAGTEGRSYAATAMVAVALTLVFVVAVERTTTGRRRAWVWWVGYGLLVLLGGLLFVYEVLIVVAHAVTLLIWVLRRGGPAGPGRYLRAALWWLVPTGAAALLLLPFVRLTSGEAAQQLYFMGRMGWGVGIVKPVFVLQFFPAAKTMAYVGWALVAVGAVLTVAVPRLRHRLPAVETTLPILLLPPAVVYVASVLVRPLYNTRYFTFATPFLAIAVAVALTLLSWRVVAVLGVVGLALLALPHWEGQRVPTAKNSSTWGSAVRVLERERAAEPPGTRDGIWYGPLPAHLNRTTEFVEAAYPRAFAGMRDLTLERSAVDVGQLWAERRPATAPLPDLTGVDRVWFVGQRTTDEPMHLQQRLSAAGWHTVGSWREHAFTIRAYERR